MASTKSRRRDYVRFSGSSGPSRGTKVSREEIEEEREKTKRAREAGIYLSEKQIAALNRRAAGDDGEVGEAGEVGEHQAGGS